MSSTGYPTGSFVCGICGMYVQLSRMDLDHIKQRAEGGPAHWDNLRVTHERCNRTRAKVVREAQPVSRTEPVKSGSGHSTHVLLISEVAQALNTSERDVLRLISKGYLGAMRFSRNNSGYRVPESELRRFIAEAMTRGSV